MKFHVTLTEEDYIAFNLDAMRHYPDAKRNMLLGRLTGLFFSAFVMLVLLAFRAPEIVLLISGIILAYLSVVFFSGFPAYRKRVSAGGSSVPQRKANCPMNRRRI